MIKSDEIGSFNEKWGLAKVELQTEKINFTGSPGTLERISGVGYDPRDSGD